MPSEDADAPADPGAPAPSNGPSSFLHSPVLKVVKASRIAGILGISLVSSIADSGTVFLIYVLGARLSSAAVVQTGISGAVLARLQWLADRLGINVVLLLSGMFLVSILGRSVLRILVERMIIKVQFDLLRSFSRQLFHGYFQIPYETFVERNSIDRINSITTETSRAGAAVNGYIRIFVQSINVLLLVLLLLAVQWQAFAFAVIAGALLLAVTRPIAVRSRAIGLQIRGATKDLWSSIMEPFRAYRVVLASRAADLFERDVEKKIERNLGLLRRVTYSQQKQGPVMELTIGAMIFIAILLALYATSDPRSGFPLILLAISGSYRIMPAISGLNAAVTLYRYNEPGLVHVLDEIRDFEQLHEAPGIHGTAPATDGSLMRFDGVTFRYRTGVEVLHGVDLAVKPGERVGIVGPSGSGKSTLVDLALGLLRPTSGEVATARRPDGEPLRIGYVPQQLILLDSTVMANVCMGEPPAQWDRARAQAALDRVGLGSTSAFPVPLDRDVAEGGLRLSGGQRQRLGLARALYRQPDLLILDEPTASLDSASEDQLVESLASQTGLPMLIVTHRERPLVLCDRVLRLDKGRLAPAGEALAR